MTVHLEDGAAPRFHSVDSVCQIQDSTCVLGVNFHGPCRCGGEPRAQPTRVRLATKGIEKFEGEVPSPRGLAGIDDLDGALLRSQH